MQISIPALLMHSGKQNLPEQQFAENYPPFSHNERAPATALCAENEYLTLPP